MRSFKYIINTVSLVRTHMFKKLVLIVALTAMPLIFSAQSELTTNINTTLEHIKQEKAAIMLEMKLAFLLKDRAESFFKTLLQDSYNKIRKDAIQIINSIILSPEFRETTDQVTTHQTELIVNNMTKFNDIIIDPSAFSLENKVNDEIAYNAFDEQSQQIFNIFYLVFASTTGSALLIKKLEAKESELLAELETLQAIDQAITA